MKELYMFDLPFQGLDEGLHQFHFQLDKLFFQAFENALIEDALIEIDLYLDKRNELSILSIHHKGHIMADCDRCLERIKLPIQGTKDVMIKYDEEEREEEEIIYISPKREKLNVGSLIYEYVSLSLPMVNIYDCENDPEAPCNEKVLGYLKPKPNQERLNPVWEELKNLNI